MARKDEKNISVWVDAEVIEWLDRMRDHGPPELRNLPRAALVRRLIEIEMQRHP